MIKLNVSAANIAVEEKETLTEGRVGLLCQFRFTDEWAGLAKTAVFDGADSRDVILKNDTVAVPAECLSAEGYSLSVGVYGKNSAGDIVIPTVYATVGKIQRSAYPSGKETAEPTPDVVAQIQQAAANAEALARSVREDADLGKFQGASGQKGDKGEKGEKGDKGDNGETGATGSPGADGKSAYAYAVEGGYTGTEAEFAAKLAAEKVANPYALTFTGAATGSYDGSEALTVEIPSGGTDVGRDWVELGVIDFSVVSGKVQLDGLANYTEFLFLWENVKNSSATASGYMLQINDTNLTVFDAIPIKPEGSSDNYGYTYLRYNDKFWDIRRSAGASKKSNYASNYQNGSYPYNVVLDVGAAASIKLAYSGAAYAATSGTVTIWGR